MIERLPTDTGRWIQAEWAGNGVDVLLRTYAKCILGQDEIARGRVEKATREDTETAEDDAETPIEQD